VLDIVIIVNDLIEKAQIKAYLNRANSIQEQYHFNIAAEFNDSRRAVNYLYQNQDFDILIVENSITGLFSGLDLALLSEKEFPNSSIILISENNDELDLAEKKMNNLTAVLNKISSSDTFVNSLFMTAVKQHRKIEAKLEEEQKLNDYREIIDHISEAVFILDVDKNNEIRYRRINKANQQKLDLSNDDIMGKTPVEIFGRETGEKMLKRYMQCVEAAEKISYTEEISFKKGRKISEVLLFPVIEDKRVKRIVGSAKDITEKQKIDAKKDFMLNHDIKTGFYDMSNFRAKIDDIWHASSAERTDNFFIVVLGIESFNVYKNLFGTKIAEKLLKKTAEIIDQKGGRNNFKALLEENLFTVIIDSENDAENKSEKILADIKSELNKMSIDDIKFDFYIDKFNLFELPKAADQILDFINENMSSKSAKISSNSIFYGSILEKIQKSDYKLVQHSSDLIKLTAETAEKFNLNQSEKEKLIMLAEIHDIGKLAVNKDILKKGEALTDKDWKDYMRHVDRSAAFADNYHDTSAVYELIYHHHEFYDGSGYPDRLKAEEIPYLNRLFSVINFYNALSTNLFYPFFDKTFYFAGLNDSNIKSELKKYSSKIFDPQIVDKFIQFV